MREIYKDNDDNMSLLNKCDQFNGWGAASSIQQNPDYMVASYLDHDNNYERKMGEVS